MPAPPPSIQCAAHSFIARIADPARGGRVVDLSLGTPSITNSRWLAGAYRTTLARNPKEALLPAALKEFSIRVAGWPMVHANQAAFDQWHEYEIAALDTLVKQHSPNSYWSYGRGQKFINILLKYACASFHCGLPPFAGFVAGNPAVASLTPFLHAPVDRYTLTYAAKLPGGDAAWRSLAWSKNLTSNDYGAVQGCLRAAANGVGISLIHYEMAYVW